MDEAEVRSKNGALGIKPGTGILLAALGVVAISGCARSAAAASGQFSAPIASFLDKCSTIKTCNGTYLVAVGDRVVYSGATGLAGDPAQTALSQTHAFDIGSISKQMTAVAILRLAKAKRLRLDDPVTKHIPDFPYKQVTIAHLLQHTSGVPDVMGGYTASLRALPQGETIDGSDVVDRLIKMAKPLESAPGAKYRYSNTGYLVLANIVEAVTKRGFAEHLSRDLFVPLGMRSTWVRTPTKQSKIAPRALGFVPGKDNTVRSMDQIPGFFLRGAGGVYSTTGDLLVWQRALVTGKLLPKELWKAATTPAILSDGSANPYGYGFALRPLPDGTKRISHGGHWRAFKSDLSYFPERDVTVIQLTNNGEDDSVDDNVGNLYRLAIEPSGVEGQLPK